MPVYVFFVTPLLPGNFPKVHERSRIKRKPLLCTSFVQDKGIVKTKTKKQWEFT